MPDFEKECYMDSIRPIEAGIITLLSSHLNMLMESILSDKVY